MKIGSRPSLGTPSLLLIAAALVCGCGESFKPATDVAGLRVLGIRSEPAELRPGATASLSALVVDPTAPGRRNTLVWISCDPDPFDLGRSACSDLGTLNDPSALLSEGDGGTPQLPEGMRLTGFGENAFYQVPQTLFSALPAEDPRRQRGTMAQLLLLTIGEEVSPAAPREELDALLERVRTREVPSVLSLFRVPVSEREQVNQNPVIGDLVLDGQRIPAGAHLFFTPGAQALLGFDAPQEAFETFIQVLPEGTEERTERIVASPYSTGGRYSLTRIAVREPVETVFTAPGGDDDPLPENGRFWVVYRDTRGGQAWREHRLHACDAPSEVPAVVRATVGERLAGGGRLLTLQGERLERILDVLVGDVAAADGRFRSTTNTFDAVLPDAATGTLPVRVRTKDCVELETGLSISVTR